MMIKAFVSILVILLVSSFCFAKTILSSAGEISSNDIALSSSEKMFKKFESISNERWLTLFTKVTGGQYLKEKEQELIGFEESTKESELEMAKEEMSEMQKWIDGIDGKTLQEKAEKITSEIMKQWKSAFIVSDIEAEELLSGQYDDAKNKNDIRQCITAFAEKRIAMPFLLRSFMQDFYDGKLRSPELEFTARLLKEHLKQISK